jgi:hypothetical protein
LSARARQDLVRKGLSSRTVVGDVGEETDTTMGEVTGELLDWSGSVMPRLS